MTDQPFLTDPDVERVVREVLAAEQFGVLASSADGWLHTSTILFAVTPAWELVHAIRPATLKAQLSYTSPRVSFQVDNRAVVAEDRTRFARIGFEGTLRRTPRHDPSWRSYLDVFAAKYAFAADLLQHAEIDLHVLTPWTVRVAVGAAPAEDYNVPPPAPTATAPSSVSEADAVEPVAAPATPATPPPDADHGPDSSRGHSPMTPRADN
ncbi:MAG: hypothetical protein U0531_02025 [Dehalococcoidia bacterium]